MIKEIKRFAGDLFRRNATRKKSYCSFESRISQHFLFNSLNSVVSLCRKNPEAAAGLVGEISTYLQTSLEDKASLIPLEEELEHVFSYVNIQKARFQDRLTVSMDIENGVQCLVPPFILQPLVDNAIRHGVLKRKEGGAVGIAISRSSHSVRICVTDDGVGMSAGEVSSLFKRCNRLHSLYKMDKILKKTGFKGLNISSAHNRGTKVTFEIPSIEQTIE